MTPAAPATTSTSSDHSPDWVERLAIPVALFLIAWPVYAWLNHGRPAELDYFVPLADALLDLRLGLSDGPSFLNELVPRNGLYYVVYPPMPALVLVPAVAFFGVDFQQESASILLGAANVAIMATILLEMGVRRMPLIILSLVFAFGTIVWYSAQAGSAWHFAHVVATFFMVLAIRACQLDARPIVIGLLFGAAVLSRLPLILALPFFVGYVADRAEREVRAERTAFGALGVERAIAWKTRVDLRQAVDLGARLLAGVAMLVVWYFIYDYLRFGTPFENGYALIPGLLEEEQYRHGFFSIAYIPHKLYALFLSGPVEAGEFPWIRPRHLGGLSVILTTPLFLWALRARRPDWFNVGAWAAVVLTLIPILTHADPGGAQFGFRYAQDFYPLLFLLTVRGLGGRISFEAWVAIAIGAMVNLWGMGSTYFDWWE